MFLHISTTPRNAEYSREHSLPPGAHCPLPTALRVVHAIISGAKRSGTISSATPLLFRTNPSSNPIAPPQHFLTIKVLLFHRDEDIRSQHRRCINDLACGCFQRPRWSTPSGDGTSQLLLGNISQLSSICIQVTPTMGTKHQAPKSGWVNREQRCCVAEHVRRD